MLCSFHIMSLSFRPFHFIYFEHASIPNGSVSFLSEHASPNETGISFLLKITNPCRTFAEKRGASVGGSGLSMTRLNIHPGVTFINLSWKVSFNWTYLHQPIGVRSLTSTMQKDIYIYRCKDIPILPVNLAIGIDCCLFPWRLTIGDPSIGSLSSRGHHVHGHRGAHTLAIRDGGGAPRRCRTFAEKHEASVGGSGLSIKADRGVNRFEPEPKSVETRFANRFAT